MVRYRAASAMAPLPFDRHGVPGSIELVDDFVTAEVVADFVDVNGVAVRSELNWLGSEIAGAAVSNNLLPASESDHQGILRLNAGGTIPATADAASLQLGLGVDSIHDSFILDTNGIYIAAVIRAVEPTTTIFGFGWAGQTAVGANNSPADLIGFAFDPGDTTNVGNEEFFCQVNGATADTEKISKLVSYVADDWVLLEIAADTTSATFRITTEDNTETIVIDGSDSVTMPVVGLRPGFVVENVGGAEEFIDIDLFVLRYMRRQPLVASWLGQ